MKVFQKLLLCFGALFTLINTTCLRQDIEDRIYDASNFEYEEKADARTCGKRQFDSDEINDGMIKCCYVQLIDCKSVHGGYTYTKTYKGCYSFDKNQNENVKEFRDKCRDYYYYCSGSKVGSTYLDKILYIILMLMAFI